jgi:hypothetical protein
MGSAWTSQLDALVDGRPRHQGCEANRSGVMARTHEFARRRVSRGSAAGRPVRRPVDFFGSRGRGCDERSHSAMVAWLLDPHERRRLGGRYWTGSSRSAFPASNLQRLGCVRSGQNFNESRPGPTSSSGAPPSPHTLVFGACQLSLSNRRISSWSRWSVTGFEGVEYSSECHDRTLPASVPPHLRRLRDTLTSGGVTLSVRGLGTVPRRPTTAVSLLDRLCHDVHIITATAKATGSPTAQPEEVTPRTREELFGHQ